MTRRIVTGFYAAAVVLAFSGCYTVLQGPRLASSLDADDPPRSSILQEEQAPSLGRFEDDRDAGDPFIYGRGGRGGYGSYPIYGYDSQGGLYGFGVPFAYGPGGYSGYGGYGSSYGPYGYGYDPYYSGAGTYVPPGYELVTTQELAGLRAENAALQATLDGGATAVPTVDPAQLERQKREAAQGAWEQRNEPTRPSSSGYRTPKPTSPAPSSSTVSSESGSSSKPTAKGSGTSAAAKRPKRGR